MGCRHLPKLFSTAVSINPSRIEGSGPKTKTSFPFSLGLSCRRHSLPLPPHPLHPVSTDRGVSSVGYSDLSRDENTASASPLFIMQLLRPEVKGDLVMDHRERGGFV